MATREEIQQLRAEVRKRHRAATRKASRLRAKGVELSGTSIDPRRDLAKVKKYTAKQMQAYLSELNNFTSRRTQYAPGMNKGLLDGNLWSEYQRVQARLNRRNRADMEQRKDLFIPAEGMTIGEIVETVPAHPTTGNPATRMPHIPQNRTSRGIPNNEQLKKLIADTKAKLDKEYIAKDTEIDRATALSMVDVIGDMELLNDIGSMSREKFRTLWKYTKTFANIMSFDYLIAKSRLHEDKTLSWHDNAFDNQLVIMKNMIDDINGVPRRSEQRKEKPNGKNGKK